jgi:alpha-tubulin suppressor-like RCC1 family protein
MNLENFQILLQKAIDTSNNTTDFLLLSRAVQSLGVGQIREVATYSNLPAAASNEGLLVFVTADERVYWSTGTAWYSLSLENEGFSYAWGSGGSGRLGDNTIVSKSSPVSVVGGFTDWCQVSTSDTFTIGVRANGTSWSWGVGTCGRLGDGTTVNKSSPVSVVGGFTNWCQASAGTIHGLGVRQNGTAWGWGGNTYGRLGDDTTVDKSSPVSVVGGFTNWCRVSAGSTHSAGLRSNGTLWAWGGAGVGQLGDNTTVNKSSPVSVVGGFTDWCQVSVGASFKLGVRTNGTVWGWGFNNVGQLGDNTVAAKSSPVSVRGGFTDWCQVSAGESHSLGVRRSGSAWAWGSSACGALGDGTTVSKSSPVLVVGGFTDWCQVSAAARYISLGVRTNGTAWAWGNGAYGILGDGTTVSKSSPVSIVGGFTDWCQVCAGGQTSSGIRKTNFV